MNNKHLKKFTGLYTGPYFDQNGNPGNVTVQLGETALLPCRVKQRGEKTVIIKQVSLNPFEKIGNDDALMGFRIKYLANIPHI